MKSPPKQKFCQRVVICGSMSFFGAMVEKRRLLSNAGIAALTPEPDDRAIASLSEEQYQQTKRRASMRHIRRIRDKKTFGVLVLNCDKHGIPDYIGANSFAEIAIAMAHYKRVYLYQGIPDFYKDELAAWGVICLDGSLSRLIADYKQTAIVETAQLTLFDL